jgi:hypothetical protein
LIYIKRSRRGAGLLGISICWSESMAETTKLSVEKALEKLRSSEPRASRSDKLDDEMEALKEKTRRMRAQRQRLDAPKGKKT